MWSKTKMNKTKKIFTIIVFFIFLLIIFISSANADEYTVRNIDIKVDELGYATITGATDHPDLLVESTQRYTSNNKGLWTLNITKQEVFSEYNFNLTLPKGAALRGFDTTGSFLLEANQNNIVINGWGYNKSLSIIVQYMVNKVSDDASTLDFNVLLIFIVLIIIVLIYLVYSIFEERRNKKIKLDDEIVNQDDKYFKGLNSRQKDIVKLLLESDNPLTQGDIQKELDIPKAAVSRNIHSLEVKGVVEIEKMGMSNLIRLKKN